MSTLYAIDPLDSYFVRDGRGFDAGADTDAAGLALPTPFTLSGLVRAALLGGPGCKRWSMWHGECTACDRRATCSVRPVVGTPRGRDGGLEGSLRLRGPWPMVGETPLLPVPLDVIASDGALTAAMAGSKTVLETALLLPRLGDARCSLPAGLLALAPSVAMDSFRAVPGWMTWSAFEEWRSGSAPPLARGETWFTLNDLVVPESRPGVSIANGGTAVDGLLYFAMHRRLRQGVRLAVEIEGLGNAEELLDAVRAIPFGGERRAASWHRLDQRAPWADLEETSPERRRKAVLLQQGWFDGAWGPTPAPGWQLRAARVERAERIGGWNGLRREPRPLLSVLPVGSVYYFEKQDGDGAATSPMPATPTPAGAGEAVAFDALGFGFSLSAAWQGVE